MGYIYSYIPYIPDCGFCCLSPHIVNVIFIYQFVTVDFPDLKEEGHMYVTSV